MAKHGLPLWGSAHQLGLVLAYLDAECRHRLMCTHRRIVEDDEHLWQYMYSASFGQRVGRSLQRFTKWCDRFALRACMVQGGYATIESRPQQPLLCYAASTQNLRVVELLLSEETVAAEQRQALQQTQLLELLVVATQRGIFRVVDRLCREFANPDVEVAAMPLKECKAKSLWLGPLAFEDSVVILLRPSLIFCVLFSPWIASLGPLADIWPDGMSETPLSNDSNDASTLSQQVVLLGKRQVATVRKLVELRADINKVATLRYSTRNQPGFTWVYEENVTPLVLANRKLQLARGLNCAPLMTICQQAVDALLELGASSDPPPPAPGIDNAMMHNDQVVRVVLSTRPGPDAYAQLIVNVPGQPERVIPGDELPNNAETPTPPNNSEPSGYPSGTAP